MFHTYNVRHITYKVIILMRLIPPAPVYSYYNTTVCVS